MIYVWFRFQASFGVAAVIPLFHDVIITIGCFSVLNREFSLTFIAALLTIMGFSLNDNVVIFDRIRENMRMGLKGRSFIDLVNLSINQTLSRTIITSGIAFVVVTILWLIGKRNHQGFRPCHDDRRGVRNLLHHLHRQRPCLSGGIRRGRL